jgi:hypothetical protein
LSTKSNVISPTLAKVVPPIGGPAVKGTSDNAQSIQIVVVEPRREARSVDWFALLPTGLTIIAAVLGYMIVERFARRREARSDLRVIAKSFREAVDNILEDATAFYRESGGSPRARSLSVTIRSKVASLSEILSALGAGGVTIDANDELILFRQAVTGSDFESLARLPLMAEDVRYISIAGAAQQLQRKADLSFYQSLL